MMDLLRRWKAIWSGRRHPGVHYLVEGGQWAIYRVGENVVRQLQEIDPRLRVSLRENPLGLYHQVVHFGSVFCLKGHVDEADASNALVATVFHHDEAADPNSTAAFDVFRRSLPRLDAVVTACQMTARDLRGMGVPEDRLHVIPLGVDLDVFSPRSPEVRAERRRALGVPEGAVCIGSFQKDGDGWGEGLEPKLIKGPDVFLDVVRRLAERRRVFVLLTGPARGYVKRGLEAAGVPFRHDFLDDTAALADYYACLDLYVVASRAEGGPKSLLESMACGVPLVSTRVGMAPDVVDDARNGLLADVEDVDALVAACVRALDDAALRRAMVENGLATVRGTTWRSVAQRYYDEVYAPLIRVRRGNR